MLVLEVMEAVVAELDAGRRVAVCAIVATRGSTPQPVGVLAAVDEAATLHGTLGGGCVEAELRRRAHLMLSSRGSSETSQRDPESAAPPADDSQVMSFNLDSDFGHDDGMICGGRIDVLVSVLSSERDAADYRQAVDRLRVGEAATLSMRTQTPDGPVEYKVHLEAQPRLVIAGAGHISRVLSAMVLPLGFAVEVIDDRAKYANSERFPPPIRPLVGAIDETLRSRPIDANTYVVIVTRGHKNDEQALAAVIDKPAKYIGMIGSRRKIKVIYDDLRHAGVTEEQLERVHAPIGLSINAVSTDEIALSIAAELVSIRRAEHRNVVEGPIELPADS